MLNSILNTIFKKVFSFLFVFLATIFVFVEAQEVDNRFCPKEEEISLLAKDAIQLQLSGYVLTKRSKCLTTSRFPHFSMVHEPSMEHVVQKPDYVLSRQAEIKILKVSLEEAGIVIVEFQIIDGKKIYKDSLSYGINQLYPQQTALSIVGCANIVETPKKIYLYDYCR